MSDKELLGSRTKPSELSLPDRARFAERFFMILLCCGEGNKRLEGFRMKTKKHISYLIYILYNVHIARINLPPDVKGKHWVIRL